MPPSPQTLRLYADASGGSDANSGTSLGDPAAAGSAGLIDLGNSSLLDLTGDTDYDSTDFADYSTSTPHLVRVAGQTSGIGINGDLFFVNAFLSGGISVGGAFNNAGTGLAWAVGGSYRSFAEALNVRGNAALNSGSTFEYRPKGSFLISETQTVPQGDPSSSFQIEGFGTTPGDGGLCIVNRGGLGSGPGILVDTDADPFIDFIKVINVAGNAWQINGPATLRDCKAAGSQAAYRLNDPAVELERCEDIDCPGPSFQYDGAGRGGYAVDCITPNDPTADYANFRFVFRPGGTVGVNTADLTITGDGGVFREDVQIGTVDMGDITVASPVPDVQNVEIFAGCDYTGNARLSLPIEAYSGYSVDGATAVFRVMPTTSYQSAGIDWTDTGSVSFTPDNNPGNTDSILTVLLELTAIQTAALFPNLPDNESYDYNYQILMTTRDDHKQIPLEGLFKVKKAGS